jgi:hypothetical protein
VGNLKVKNIRLKHLKQTKKDVDMIKIIRGKGKKGNCYRRGGHG